MKLLRSAALLLIIGLSLCVRPAQADPPHLVVRVYYANQAQLQALASRYEPWEVHPQAGYALVSIAAEDFARLQALGLRLEIDLELTERASRLARPQPDQASGIPGYACYRTVEETYTSAAALAQAHPGLVSWTDIGDSWEKHTSGGAAGYDLRVLRLTNQAIPGPKPVFFAIAGLHAREYAPAELLTRFAEQLANGYGNDPDATWLLDYHELHLLLQANPDGRKLAEGGNDWRKNTNQNYCAAAPAQYGADLNRNFAFQWSCCGGSSSYECDETYRGAAAASEPETHAIQQYLKTLFPDQRLPDLNAPAPPDAAGIFLDLHSYGGLVLWPWGHTASPAPNHAALQTLGSRLAFFNQYIPEPANLLYLTDGGSTDFAYGELGVAAYTFELGSRFFEQCQAFEQDILPTNVAALLYAARVSAAPYRLPAGPDIRAISSAWNNGPSGSAIRLQATASDTSFSDEAGEPVQAVIKAEYTIDIPPWITTTAAVAHTLLPVDGQFDSPTEQIHAWIDLGGLTAQTHLVFVRAQDASGQWGPVSAHFIDARRLIYLPVISTH